MDSRHDFTSKKVFPGYFSELSEKANPSLIGIRLDGQSHEVIAHLLAWGVPSLVLRCGSACRSVTRRSSAMGQSGGSHPTRHRTRADVEKDAVPGDVRANVRAFARARE